MRFPSLILHNVTARRGRSIFTAIAVAIGVATVVTIGVVTSSLKASAVQILQTGSADFTVAQKGVADVLSSVLDARDLQEIKSTPGVKTAVGALITTTELDADHPLFIMIGLPPEDQSVFGVRVLEGRTYGDTAPAEAMLGYRAAQNLGKKVGDKVEIDGDPYVVTGLFSTGNAIGDSAAMFPLIPMQAKQRTPGNVTLAFVRTKPGVDIDSVRHRIEREHPQVTTVRTATEFGRVDRNLQLISAADRGAVIITLLIGAVIVMNTMLLSFFERTREFGLLRAIGWSRGRIVLLVIFEALVISVVGAGAGVGLSFLGTLALEHVKQLRGVLEPVYSAGIFGRALYLAGGMALLGAIYPALRAAFLVPLEALRRE